MDAEREVYKLLRPFGITKKYIGVSQLTLALLILLEDPTSLHAVQKQIYMIIAERFCVNWKSIERNIRTLSTAAWRANPEYLELLAQYPLEKRPTSGDHAAEHPHETGVSCAWRIPPSFLHRLDGLTVGFLRFRF